MYHIDHDFFNYLAPNLNNALQAFRLPMYYFISGIFFKLYDGYADFTRRKVNNILVPFVFFIVLNFVMRCVEALLRHIVGADPIEVNPVMLVEPFYLRRPISLCDWGRGTLTLVVRETGEGTKAMAKMIPGQKADLLFPLGNGFRCGLTGDHPLLVGGGVVFLECEDREKLLAFYRREPNCFEPIGERVAQDDCTKYLQLMRFL
jgi:hypothetical protein